MSTTVADLVQQAKSEIENLGVDEMATEIAQVDVLVVDVREPSEVEENGAIEASVLAPRGMLEFYADPASPYHKAEFDPERRVVLYCAAGSRSALAGQALRRLGYQDVAHLEGGFKAWREAGMPVRS